MRNDWKRQITLFFVSQATSLFGSALVQYAIMWHITLETKSGVMMTLAILFGFVPTFLLSPFAGVWADRYDRKKLIVFADAFIALVTLALAFVFLNGTRSIALLFAASALRSVGSAIQGPAVGAILPQIVPEDQLTRMNGINGTIQSVTMLAAPMVSGALLTFASIETIFFIDVVTAAMAIMVLTLLLKVAPHAKATRSQELSYFADMALGFRYIREHRYLVSFFLYIGVLMFLVVPAAFLTPLQTTRSFGPDVWRLTAIEIVFSVGMMLGGLLISTWGGFKNRMRTMAFSTMVMAACTVALGLVPVFWPYLAIMVLFGIAIPLYNTPAAVIIQEQVEQNFMGRVFSVLTMLSTSVMPLGMLVFGPLADQVRIEYLLVGSGSLLFLHGLRLISSRRLMAAGEPREAQSPTISD